MFKSTIKIAVTFIFSFSAVFAAHATLITEDLSEDNYIEYKGLQWAWASPVNAKDWLGVNTLYTPELHSGWRYATDDEMTILKTELSLAHFTRTDEQGDSYYVHAVQYWNDFFTNVTDFNNLINILAMEVASELKETHLDLNAYYDTFYVRDIIVDEQEHNAPTPPAVVVSAPTSLLLMLIAFFTLVIRARKLN